MQSLVHLLISTCAQTGHFYVSVGSPMTLLCTMVHLLGVTIRKDFIFCMKLQIYSDQKSSKLFQKVFSTYSQCGNKYPKNLLLIFKIITYSKFVSWPSTTKLKCFQDSKMFSLPSLLIIFRLF